jgi:hypothetical protein
LQKILQKIIFDRTRNPMPKKFQKDRLWSQRFDLSPPKKGRSISKQREETVPNERKRKGRGVKRKGNNKKLSLWLALSSISHKRLFVGIISFFQ